MHSPAYLTCACFSGLLSQSESCCDLSSGFPRHLSTSKLRPVASLYPILAAVVVASLRLSIATAPDDSSCGVEEYEEMWAVSQIFMLERAVVSTPRPAWSFAVCDLCDGCVQVHWASKLFWWSWLLLRGDGEWSNGWLGMESEFERGCRSRGWLGREQLHKLFLWRADSFSPSTCGHKKIKFNISKPPHNNYY